MLEPAGCEQHIANALAPQSLRELRRRTIVAVGRKVVHAEHLYLGIVIKARRKIGTQENDPASLRKMRVHKLHHLVLFFVRVVLLKIAVPRLGARQERHSLQSHIKSKGSRRDSEREGDQEQNRAG